MSLVYGEINFPDSRAFFDDYEDYDDQNDTSIPKKYVLIKL